VRNRVRFGSTVLVAIAATTLTAAVGLTAPAATASTPTTHVGFWAGQSVTPCLALDPLTCPRDLSAYTPDVWNALAAGHSFLDMDIVYGSDFGSAIAGVNQRTDARQLIQQANANGVEVNAWITVPLSKGTFANEQNATTIQSAVKAYAGWVTQNNLTIGQPILDLEFPLGDQAVNDALTTGDLSGVESLMTANIDPSAQCRAMATYRDTITWAHQHGLPMSGSPVPFALDDLANGNMALQDALNIVAFPPFGYDELYLQAYRAQGIDLGSGYVASYYRDMQSYFGTSGQISLGNSGVAPYDVLSSLVNDVRMVAGMGATTVPIFDLDGAVKAFGATGISAILAAGRNPMTGSELAAAQQMTATGTDARQLFTTLDAFATASTPLVTAAALHPQLPNSYPSGCGNMNA
jgi:hypothetical protein